MLKAKIERKISVQKFAKFWPFRGLEIRGYKK